MAISRTLSVTDGGLRNKYKHLLLDPCNAPLCQSPYGGDAGSTIVRAHGYRNTQFDAYVFFYHPLWGGFENQVNGGAVGTLKPISATQANVVTAGRALAACLDTTWIGTESARSGIVQCGVVPGTVVHTYLDATYGGANNSIDANNITYLISNMERMPVDRCQVNWFPAEADEQFSGPITAYSAANNNLVAERMCKTHFMVVFVAGAGTQNNVRIGITEVFEKSQLLSIVGQGGTSQPWNLQSASTPGVNVKSLLAELTSRDSSWYLNTFRKIAKFGIGMVGATYTAGLPGALGYLTQAIAGGATFGGKQGRNVLPAR